MAEGSRSGSVPLYNGSGSRRPKNIRIRIRNTTENEHGGKANQTTSRRLNHSLCVQDPGDARGEAEPALQVLFRYSRGNHQSGQADGPLWPGVCTIHARIFLNHLLGHYIVRDPVPRLYTDQIPDLFFLALKQMTVVAVRKKYKMSTFCRNSFGSGFSIGRSGLVHFEGTWILLYPSATFYLILAFSSRIFFGTVCHNKS